MRAIANINFEKLMARFLQSNAGKALVAEEDRATAADRRRAVARLAELKTSGSQQTRQFDAAREQSLAKYNTAKAHLETCAVALDDLTRTRNATAWRFSSERDGIERMLESTCSPEIDEIIEEIRWAIEEAQTNGISSIPIGSRSTLYGAAVRLFVSNGPSAHTFMQTAFELLAAAKALRLTADDETAMLKKVDALRDQLRLSFNAIDIEQVEVHPPQFVKGDAR